LKTFEKNSISIECFECKQSHPISTHQNVEQTVGIQTLYLEPSSKWHLSGCQNSILVPLGSQKVRDGHLILSILSKWTFCLAAVCVYISMSTDRVMEWQQRRNWSQFRSNFNKRTFSILKGKFKKFSEWFKSILHALFLIFSVRINAYFAVE